jgi:hypothetical protein
MRQLNGLIPVAAPLTINPSYGSGGFEIMREFLASVVAALVIAVIGMYALDPAWRSADKAYTTTGTRLTDTGHNLVGKDWHSSKRF